MGFAYLIVGCFFLLNPSISIFDILPDFIGYAFILAGLVKASKLSADFEAAYRSFRTLFIITLGRMLTLALAGGDDQTWLLIVVFCFGLVEGFLSLRAFNSMFEGFCYTAERGESTAVFGKLSETKLITTIFVIARQALCILPELSLLSSSEYGEVTTHGINSLAQYRLIFNIFGAIVSLAFGIFWFIRVRGYLKGVRTDKVYIDMLEEKYRYTVGENASAKLYHALRFSLILLLVAAVFSIELPFDGFNYLPHAISAILILIAARHLIPYFKPEATKTVRWSLVYTIVSVVVWIYNFVYMRMVFGAMLDAEEEGLVLSYAEVLDSAVKKDFLVQDGFILLCVLTVVEAVFFVFLVRQLTALLNTILLKYTPKKEEKRPEDDEYAEWSHMLPKAKEFEPKTSYLRLMIMKVFGYTCAVLGPIQTALSFIFPAFWMIATLFRIAWVFLFYLTVSKAKDLVETDREMEGEMLPPHEMVK